MTLSISASGCHILSYLTLSHFTWIYLTLAFHSLPFYPVISFDSILFPIPFPSLPFFSLHYPTLPYSTLLGRLRGVTVSAVGHRFIPPGFKPWEGYGRRGFHLSLNLITFGDHSAHLAYIVPKSGRKTAKKKLYYLVPIIYLALPRSVLSLLHFALHVHFPCDPYLPSAVIHYLSIGGASVV